MKNLILLEATQKAFDPMPIVKSIKKLMNTCKLTKFKSVGECSKMYSAFFMPTLPEDVGNMDLTFENWTIVYNTLLNDQSFCDNMVYFMAMYQPADYTGMFHGLINMIDSEYEELGNTRLRYLANAKAFFKSFNQRMDAIAELIKMQVNDPDAIKFTTIVNSVITSDIFYINRMIDRLNNQVDPDDLTLEVKVGLSEDAKEILGLLENYDNEIIKFEEPIDEAVVKNAIMKVKEQHIKAKKASRAFDEFIMKKVKTARENRRNRKHAEMVGEALRINHELKKLLGSLAIGALNPAIGVITWVVSTVVDRHTDKRDRDVLVGQIKDELEIVEEKISIAERNGDDKGKIELIRIRQRLKKEYERIMKFQWDPNRNNR